MIIDDWTADWETGKFPITILGECYIPQPMGSLKKDTAVSKHLNHLEFCAQSSL